MHGEDPPVVIVPFYPTGALTDHFPMTILLHVPAEPETISANLREATEIAVKHMTHQLKSKWRDEDQ